SSSWPPFSSPFSSNISSTLSPPPPPELPSCGNGVASFGICRLEISAADFSSKAFSSFCEIFKVLGLQMPVPLAPYPSPPAPSYTPTPPPDGGRQSQLVCSGCRNLLLFPAGATSVCCAVCNSVTAVPPPGKKESNLFHLVDLRAEKIDEAFVFDHRHRNGSAGMWRMPHLADVHSWGDERAMLMLSHCEPGIGSKPSSTCELWKLQDAADVPVRSSVCQMCGLQLRYIRWGIIL
ncbi:Protein LSD1, partial [Linum grandiflorum]